MTTAPIEIRRATTAAEIVRAQEVFDGPAVPAAVERFLAERGHHLLVASIGGEVAGVVSGVEMTHPDKGTEMFLYELGVVERWRGRGVGRALVDALCTVAMEAGCYGMWVLTEVDNEPAIRTYRSAGSSAGSRELLLEWTFPTPGAVGDT